MANIIHINTDGSMTTVNVYLRGGILSTASNVTVIDGFWVKKGSGNVASTIEVGDRIIGWLDDTTAIAGKVNALPYTDSGNIDNALAGEII